jgi:RNA polymerase sigma factor (sigma-70 family)
MATIAPEVSIPARDEAFESLYRRYVEDVYHYALALLRNPADAEDVTQTTFMNAYRAFSRGAQIEKPQNWLIKIAHNVARTRYARSTRRVKEVPLEDHVEQLAIPEDERPNVEGVLRALGRLPFNQRAALVMRELEGRSYIEIADTLNVSVAAVETLIFRARRSLRVQASALRSLGAVPLPGSLAQLFGGSGAVSGGGALVGTGFIVKATVALVVGAVATGLAGVERKQPNAAQRAPTAQALPQPQVGVRDVVRKKVRVLRSVSQQKGWGQTPSGSDPLGSDPSSSPTNTSLPSPTAAATSPLPTSTLNSAPQTVTSAVSTTPVNEVVDTVDSTVSSATSALPVQLPSAPSLPVQTPPLPTLP